MKTNKNIIFALIAMAVGALCFFVQKAAIKWLCPCQGIKADTVIYYRPVHDTVFKEVQSPLPYPVYSTDTFLKDVDTLAIIAKFLKAYHYSDTIADSSIMAIIDDDIFQNEIIKRAFKYSLLQEKVVTIEKTVQKQAKGLYVGPFMGYMGENANMGISGLYAFKNHAISLNMGIDKSIVGSYYWKVK